jgi:23S rRNA (cytosine1962-C5)-methyltransferase
MEKTSLRKRKDKAASAPSLDSAPAAGRVPAGALPRVVLKQGETRRLQAGHRWIFSNEIARVLPSSEGSIPAPGALAEVVASTGRPLGVAHYHPSTLIAARMLGGPMPPASQADEPAWLSAALRQAVDRRAGLAASGREAYRLIHSDADGLPGLVADRYGPLVVVQLLTAGMERLREPVFEALRGLEGVQYLYEGGGSRFREMEGLAERDGWVGEAPAQPLQGAVRHASGLEWRFRVDPERGQKTAEFLDQVENRFWLAERLRQEGRDLSSLKVLDLFCHSGLWGIGLAKMGAARATLVDASAAALGLARENARLNGVAERCAFHEEDAFKALERLRSAGERFDILVVDPPAFAKSRKTAATALSAYERLNVLALGVAAPEALVVSCSCSYHIDAGSFLQTLGRAARRANRRAWVAAERSQSSDHPVLLGMEETQYLKVVGLRLLD